MLTLSSGKKERGSKLLSLRQGRPSDDKIAIGRFSFVRRTTLCSERSLFPRVLAAAAGLLLTALPVLAKKVHKANPKMPFVHQQARITNSGSTNTRGYVIVLEQTASYAASVEVRYLDTGADEKGEFITPQLNNKFFSDLVAAMPLTGLPVHHGMRSASFGTQTAVTYKGQTSPDLTFAADPRTMALKADIDAITKALHVGNAPRHPIVIDKNGAIINSTKN